jgi:hypothetical protein
MQKLCQIIIMVFCGLSAVYITQQIRTCPLPAQELHGLPAVFLGLACIGFMLMLGIVMAVATGIYPGMKK